MRKFIVAALCIALAGCSSLSTTALLRLSTFDPLSVDPARLRVALRVPEWIDAQEGKTKLTISTVAELNRPDQVFVLVPDTDPGELALIEMMREKRTRVAAFRFDTADLPRLNTTLAELRQLRASRPNMRNGSMTVVMLPCYYGELNPGPIPVSAFVKIEKMDSYMTLMSDVDVRAMEGVEASLKACG